jgi:dihydroorotate dehydrogenase electron transfer subunit
MKAVAKIAKERDIDCEASLENLMACGFGVCLCCIQETDKGNLCVCTEGPVFNTKDLKW